MVLCIVEVKQCLSSHQPNEYPLVWQKYLDPAWLHPKPQVGCEFYMKLIFLFLNLSHFLTQLFSFIFHVSDIHSANIKQAIK